VQTISATEGYDGITVTLTVSIDPAICGLPSLAKQAWLETSDNGDTRQDAYRVAALGALRDALAPARLGLESSQIELSCFLLDKESAAIAETKAREDHFHTTIEALQSKLKAATEGNEATATTKAKRTRGARK
jgi:hypothetical protein